MTLARTRAEVVELGRALYDRGVTPGRTGNLSVHTEAGVVMTPTGVSLGRLQPEQLSVLDTDGRLTDGPPPSKEWALHAALYARGDHDSVTAVAHVHSTHAVAVSLLTDLDPARPLMPLTAYFVMRVGAMPLLPYYPPGDAGLAAAINALPAGVNAALLANHGSVVGATSLEAAVAAVEEIEETAKLQLLLQGRAIRPLTPAQVTAIERT